MSATAELTALANAGVGALTQLVKPALAGGLRSIAGAAIGAAMGRVPALLAVELALKKSGLLPRGFAGAAGDLITRALDYALDGGVTTESVDDVTTAVIAALQALSDAGPDATPAVRLTKAMHAVAQARLATDPVHETSADRIRSSPIPEGVSLAAHAQYLADTLRTSADAELQLLLYRVIHRK